MWISKNYLNLKDLILKQYIYLIIIKKKVKITKRVDEKDLTMDDISHFMTEYFINKAKQISKLGIL